MARHASTMTPLRPSALGFTLLELSVALVVLMVGVLGVIQLYQFGLGKVRALNEAAVARTLVQNEIEYLRSVPFSELADVNAASFVGQPLDKTGLVNPVGSVTIRDYPGLEGKLKEVTITLRWHGDVGRAIEERAVTLIAARGAE